MLPFSFHPSQLGSCLWTAYSMLTDSLQHSHASIWSVKEINVPDCQEGQAGVVAGVFQWVK